MDELWCDWQWDDPIGEARAALAETVAHIDQLLLEVERGAWPSCGPSCEPPPFC